MVERVGLGLICALLISACALQVERERADAQLGTRDEGLQLLAGAATLGKQPKRYDQPDQAMAYFVNQRVGEGQSVDASRWIEAQQAARELPLFSSKLDAQIDSNGRAAVAPWTALGPGNVGGRTRVIRFRPGTPSTMYAGGVAGGVWRSTNSGASWAPIGDLISNIAVTAMVIDPAAPDRMFIGTGEGFFNFDAVRGAGIFTSLDGGATWTQLASTANSNFHYVNDLVMSPNDSNVLYAATRTGLWRSTDGGVSWVVQAGVTATSNGCLDIEARPGVSPDTVLVSCGSFAPGTVYRNTNANGGGAWNSVLALRNLGVAGRNQGRVTLAYAPSDTNYVYALIACTASSAGACGNFDTGLLAVYRSTNGGANWTSRFTNSSLFGGPFLVSDLLLSNPLVQGCQGNPGFNQGWYDNIIAVDPVDREKVYTGGIDIFRSDDGGQTYGVISYWWLQGQAQQYAHADNHLITFHPSYNGTTESRTYLGNDGGVFVATSANSVAHGTGGSNVCPQVFADLRGPTWTSLNTGYGVTQFYHGLPYPGGTTYFGGTQDNGTNRGSDGGGINAWTEVFGGDGGYVAVDPSNTNTLYVETTTISIQKSIDGGANFAAATTGIADTGCGSFINPFIMDPNNANRLWTSNNRLWRTANAAGNWTQASAAIPGTSCASNSARFSAYAVAPGDSNLLVAGTTGGQICRLTNATSSNSGTALANCTSPVGSATISSISFDPTTTGTQNTRVVYATVSRFGVQQLLKSTNGGQTWSAITNRAFGGLPDVPAHTVVADPNYPDGTNGSQRLYVGTDIGIFVTIDGGTTWMREHTGFANTVIENLVLQTNGGTRELFAFSHGRSVFKTSLRAAASYCSSGSVGIPDNSTGGVDQSINVSQATGTVTDLNLTLELDHTRVGDLIVTLTHVGSGTTVTALDRPGVPATANGCTGNNIAALFDDDADVTAENTCAGSTPTIEGRFRPTAAFSGMNGLSIGGTWRINVSDRNGGQTGTLNQWCVIATSNADAQVPVTLSALSSTLLGSGVRIQFETASNLGTVAFEVLDHQGSVVARIPSDGDSTSAKSYQIDAPLAAGMPFSLRSVEASGKRLPLGEYQVGLSVGASATADEATFDWAATVVQEQQRAQLRQANQAAGAGARAWLMVDSDGPQRLSYEQLQSAGLNGFAGVSIQDLRLRRQGAPIAIAIESADASFGPGDELLFVGEANRSLYTQKAAYLLDLGGGGPGLTTLVEASDTAQPVDSHRRVLRAEQDRVYSFSSPTGDPWAWKRVVSVGAPATTSVEIATPDFSNRGEVTLRAQIWGGLDADGSAPDHHVQLRLNGTLIDDRRFDGVTEQMITVTLPASAMVAGNNIIELDLPGDTGFDADVVYLESIELRYEALIQAELGLAAWTSESGGGSIPELFANGFEVNSGTRCEDCPAFRVTGVNGSARLLRESGSRLSTGLISGLSGNDVLAISTSAGDRLWLAEPGSLARPEVRVPIDTAGLSDGPAGYLVISHPSFADQLGPLLAARSQSGRNVKLALTDQIYDAYGDGDFGAPAIAAYIAQMRASHGTTEVLLVGADSYDYRGNLATPSMSFVPGPYVQTEALVRFAPSDAALVDAAGDGVPDLAIGRLPVRTSVELDAVLSKILSYPAATNRSALLVSDRSGFGASDFATGSESVFQALTGWGLERAYLDLLTPEQIRAQLVSSVDSGVGLVQYFGHSSPNRWSFENVLTSAQLSNGLLHNTSTPTTVWQWGCWNTYHVDPQAGSMGHAWMNQSSGAAAVIGAATLTEASHDRALAEKLAAIVATQPGIAIGTALQLAKQELAVEQPSWRDVLLGITLLGDPAMALP